MQRCKRAAQQVARETVGVVAACAACVGILTIEDIYDEGA